MKTIEERTDKLIDEIEAGHIHLVRSRIIRQIEKKFENEKDPDRRWMIHFVLSNLR